MPRKLKSWRWTGRTMWITAWEPIPPGWYPYQTTAETHYAPAGRYIRQRRRWWPIMVLLRIMRAAGELRD